MQCIHERNFQYILEAGKLLNPLYAGPLHLFEKVVEFGNIEVKDIVRRALDSYENYNLLATITRQSQSLRTVIPQPITKKLKLRRTDVLEWVEDENGHVIVKNIGTPIFRKR